jgi:hypothetical protein
MGPVTVFDKSFLQSLNLDESVWFDHFFYSIITPLFYIECLADLESKPRNGLSPEDHLSTLAIKTPQMAGTPCHFHQTLLHFNFGGLCAFLYADSAGHKGSNQRSMVIQNFK